MTYDWKICTNKRRQPHFTGTASAKKKYLKDRHTSEEHKTNRLMPSQWSLPRHGSAGVSTLHLPKLGKGQRHVSPIDDFIILITVDDHYSISITSRSIQCKIGSIRFTSRHWVHWIAEKFVKMFARTITVTINELGIMARVAPSIFHAVLSFWDQVISGCKFARLMRQCKEGNEKIGECKSHA